MPDAARIDLGKCYPVVPIEEIRLAAAFAELPNGEQVVSKLMAELFDHPDMHVRRIAVNACRSTAAFGVSGLMESLTRKLEELRRREAMTPDDWASDDPIAPRIEQRFAAWRKRPGA